MKWYHYDDKYIFMVEFSQSHLFLQINQKGSEKPLELAFDKMVTSLGNGMIK